MMIKRINPRKANSGPGADPRVEFSILLHGNHLMVMLIFQEFQKKT